MRRIEGERESGGVGGFCFCFFFNIRGILTSHVGEASIKNCKIWTSEITLSSIFFLCDRRLICLFTLFWLTKRISLISRDNVMSQFMILFQCYTFVNFFINFSVKYRYGISGAHYSAN